MERYCEERYKRKKLWYRMYLGATRFIHFPMLNIIWIPLIVGTVTLFSMKDEMMSMFKFSQRFIPLFNVCLNVAVVFFVVSIGIAILKGIGELIARKDEADIRMVFDEKDFKYGEPILVYKKKNKKNGVIVREFFSAIPMEKWRARQEALSDRMNIHLIEDISYGGKHNDNGNRIVIKSAKGRKSTKRGVLYDDSL